jgi:hypothetical protein
MDDFGPDCLSQKRCVSFFSWPDVLPRPLVQPRNRPLASKDPIRIAGGLNLYAFCDNNPVNFVDPFGKSPGGALIKFIIANLLWEGIKKLRDIPMGPSIQLPVEEDGKVHHEGCGCQLCAEKRKDKDKNDNKNSE